MIVTSEADIWPWLMLRNAIVEQTVYDFEMMISDAPLPSNMYCASEMSISAIRSFTKDTKVDVWLDKIYRIYRREFRPYVEEHEDEIISAWKKVKKDKTKYGASVAYKDDPHKCPLCGGILRPKRICGVNVIGCTGCYLNVRQKGGKKKCST